MSKKESAIESTYELILINALYFMACQLASFVPKNEGQLIMDAAICSQSEIEEIGEEGTREALELLISKEIEQITALKKWEVLSNEH